MGLLLSSVVYIANIQRVWNQCHNGHKMFLLVALYLRCYQQFHSKVVFCQPWSYCRHFSMYIKRINITVVEPVWIISSGLPKEVVLCRWSLAKVKTSSIMDGQPLETFFSTLKFGQIKSFVSYISSFPVYSVWKWVNYSTIPNHFDKKSKIVLEQPCSFQSVD